MDSGNGNEKARRLTGPYDPKKCEACGRCLVECPVMKLSPRAAKREMAALSAGRPGRHVLRKCETCMACNLVCPNGANPARLFQSRFYDYISRHGLPPWSPYFQPHAEPNFRTTVIRRLPPDEKKLLAKWADTSPCEEFAFPGCNLCTAPYLTRAKFLEGLNIRGGLRYCCGEMYFRTGMFDQLARTAERLNRWLDTLGARRMMVLCTAGYNLFTNVLPQFGLKTDIEITSYLPWLWERIESGAIEIKKPLNMTITIQESCHAKLFGPEYYEIPRKILARLGAEVREMKHSKENAFCCGIGGGFPAKKQYHPMAVAKSTLRMIEESGRTGADATMTYCAGCLLSMSSFIGLVPETKPVYHIFELVQLATGETPERRNLARGRAMLAGSALHQFPKIFFPSRAKPPKIP